MAGAVAGYGMLQSMAPPILSPAAFGQGFEPPVDSDTDLSWLLHAVKAVDDSPDSAAANLLGGYPGSVRQDWQAMLDRADTVDMPPEAARLLRGIALSGMKRHAEAIRCFDDMLKTDPESAVALACRVHALGMLNRRDEAM